jgi:hypothetical protein
MAMFTAVLLGVWWCADGAGYKIGSGCNALAAAARATLADGCRSFSRRAGAEKKQRVAAILIGPPAPTPQSTVMHIANKRLDVMERNKSLSRRPKRAEANCSI